jgi:peptidoglycan/LPS O-acetylase OafA/YrhL
MVNRIARIYPMYFLLTTITFLVLALQESNVYKTDLFTYFMNITFLRGYFEELKFTGIAQGWSLTVEETFYILAPLIFILIKRSLSFLILIPLVLVSFGVLLVSIFSKVEFLGFFSNFDLLFNYIFFGRCFEFFSGIFLALLFRRQLVKVKFTSFTYAGIAGMAISILLISLQKGEYDFGIRKPMGMFLNTVVLPLIGVVPFFYGLLTEKTIVSRVLGSDLFVLLGKSSYVFYLIHAGIFAAALNKWIGDYTLVFLSVNVLAILMFKFIEEPANNFIRAKFSK